MVNKKETILMEAKRLFGRNGYLGFTLKQLATACEMTAPALYYFYSSKADLFRDCLLSEFESRRERLIECAANTGTLQEFARELTYIAFEQCGAYNFRAGQAMQEIIHLPEEMQGELYTAWDHHLIAPVEEFLTRVLPQGDAAISHKLLATFLINMATFSATKEEQFDREQLALLMTAAAKGLEDTMMAPSQ